MFIYSLHIAKRYEYVFASLHSKIMKKIHWWLNTLLHFGRFNRLSFFYMSSSVCCHISTDMASWQLTFKTNLFVFILSESSLVVKITGAKTFVIKRIFALVISLSLSNFLDPHIKVSGKLENVKKARGLVMEVLDTKCTRVTLKMDVSHTEHSHVIGKGMQCWCLVSIC